MTYVRGYERRDGTKVQAHYRGSSPVTELCLALADITVTSFTESVATIAIRILPPQQRARYAEEFRNELWTLAEEGESRWRQVAHAARLVWHTPRLYLALRSPHRQKASL